MNTRVVVVTGAASGIGLGVAQRLSAAGHPVALIDRDGPGVQSAAEALSTGDCPARGYEVDVSDRTALERVFATLRGDLGPVAILVTSAGVESFDDTLTLTPETWDRVLAVNLTGTFSCMQLAVRDMVSRGWGRIVTIASSSAQSGAAKMAHYVASKAGVIGLTRAFARDFAGHGVTVNCIPPAIVDTPMARHAAAAGDVPSVEVLAKLAPIPRAGTPADIAAATAFLCSDEASYITGQLIGVNGGIYM